MSRLRLRAVPQQQASGAPIAHHLVATGALGEGDADAAGKGLWGAAH